MAASKKEKAFLTALFGAMALGLLAMIGATIFLIQQIPEPPKPVFCVKCAAKFPASQFNEDEQLLLRFRAELQMLELVADYYERHPFGLPARPDEVSPDDRKAAEYLRTRSSSLKPRMNFVTTSIKKLEVRLRPDCLLCPKCKNAELKIHDEDDL